MDETQNTIFSRLKIADPHEETAISCENYNRQFLLRLAGELYNSYEAASLPLNLRKMLVNAQLVHANYRLSVIISKTINFEETLRINSGLAKDDWMLQLAENLEVYLDLLHNYPSLADVADYIYNSELNIFTETIDAIKNDFEELKLQGWIDSTFSKISHLHYLTTETHEGGKNVLLFQSEGQSLFALKPRSATLESFTTDFIKAFLKDHFPNDEWQLPIYLQRENYSWVSWCKYIPCANAADAIKQHRNAGLLLALSVSLGITDLLCENIIAHVDHLVPVDLECVLHHQRIRGDLGQNQYRWSVLNTGLLTVALKPRNGSVIDLSGIAALGTLSPSSKVHRPVEGSYNLGCSDIPDVRVWHCGEVFIQGFEAGYFKMLEHKDVFLRFINEAKNKSGRYIYRSTEEYYEILDSSLSPVLLRDPQRRYDYIRSCLMQPDLSEDLKVIEAECKSIYFGDIPRFKTMPNEQTIESIYLSSPTDLTKVNLGAKNCIDYIKLATVKTLSYETSLIEENFKALRKAYYKYYERKENYNSPEKNGALAVVEEYHNDISTFIDEQLKDGSGLNFFANSSGYSLGAMDVSYIHGKTGFLLGCKIAKIKDCDVRKSSRELLYKLIEDVEKFGDVYIGGASVGYISTLLPLIKTTEEPYQYAVDYYAGLLLNILKSKYKKIIDKFDFHNGAFGVLAIASIYAEYSKKIEWKNFCESLFDDMVQKGTTEKFDLRYPTSNGNSAHIEGLLSGVSHGQSGAIYSIALYGVLFPDHQKLAMSVLTRLIPSELKLYDHTRHGWLDWRAGSDKGSLTYSWLHGAPGIILTLKYVQDNYDIPLVNDFLKNIEKESVFLACLKSAFSQNEHGISHGPLGILLCSHRLSVDIKDSALTSAVIAAKRFYNHDICPNISLFTGKLGDLLATNELIIGNTFFPLFPHEIILGGRE